MKRKVSVIITVFVAVCLTISGCGSKQGVLDKKHDSNKDVKDVSAVLEGYSLPITKEPLTLKFATVDNPDVAHSYTQNLPAFAELEKRTGIHVEFDVAPQDQYNTTMQTRLAAGHNLPDLVRLPDDPIIYAKDGLIISMDSLINQYAPNILKLFEERPDVKKSLTAPDGKIYVVSAVVDARSMVNLVGLGMRKDWLKELDLQEPDTMDDWFDVLKAFKNRDPNGNGKNDEIPVIAMNTSGLYKFAWTYGLHFTLSDGWYDDEDGKVIYEWIDERTKQWLIEMNKWYKAELIDPDMNVQQYDKYTAKAIGNIGGAAVNDMTMQYPQWNEMIAADFPDAKWEGIVPPQAGQGNRIMEKEQPIEGIYYGITKDCKNPDIVMKWLDYMYASEEGKILMGNFGIEGKSYNIVDGVPKFTDFILKNEKGSGLAMNSIGINGNFPRILMKEMIEQRFLRYTDEIAQSNKATKYYVPSFPRILATKEETDQYISLMSDIDTYREEMILRFIQGKEDIDTFDKFVEQIKNMGIDQAIKIKQDQYDRYKKN